MRLYNCLICLIIFSVALTLSAATTWANNTPKRILLLLSYNYNLPWQRLAMDSLLSTIESANTPKAHIYIEYTGLSESPTHSLHVTLWEYFRRKYPSAHWDLVICIGLQSSNFLLHDGRYFFGETPVVLLSTTREGLNRPELDANITGVFESIDPKGSIDLALQMWPNTRHITVISGASELDDYYRKKVNHALQENINGLNIDYLSGLSVDELGRKVALLPKHSIILYVLTFKDARGTSLIPNEVVAHIAAKANAPIFGLWESMLGSGIVGGELSSPTTAGRIAAEMGLHILAGEKPSGIPIVQGVNAYMFDWRQLKRWNISDKNLPPGSVVRFKTPSFVELYRNYIVAAIVLVVIEFLLIVVLLYNRNKYIETQRALTESQKMLEQRVEERTRHLKEENTERRNAEKKLRESEDFLSTILDSIQDGISVLDCDLNIIRVNTAMKKLYPHVLPLEGRKCYQAYHGKQAPCDICPTVRAARTGKLEFNEVPLIRSDGVVGTLELFAFPMFDNSGGVTAIIEYVRDITERVRARELLVERELIYRSLFETNISIMLLVDPENGKIIDANPSACHYYGYSKEAMQQMNISEINTLTKEEIRMEMEKARSEERNYFIFRHRLSNGGIRDVEVFSGPISRKGRTLLCSIVHDISERKKIEKEREEVIVQLQKALSEVKTLRGFIPICASCKKIRDDKGYWNQIESYIQTHSEAEFSHSLCPECVKKLYPFLKT